MKVRACATAIEPKQVKVASSKGDGSYYNVLPSTIWNDAVCECPGYIHRGSCRHITAVEMARCLFVSPDTEDVGEPCPHCGENTVEFEMEPEL